MVSSHMLVSIEVFHHFSSGLIPGILVLSQSPPYYLLKLCRCPALAAEAGIVQNFGITFGALDSHLFPSSIHEMRLVPLGDNVNAGL